MKTAPIPLRPDYAAETDKNARMFVAMAKYIAMAGKAGMPPADLAQQSRALPPIVEALRAMEGHRVPRAIKAAQSAGTTTNWGVDLAPYAVLADGFLNSLRNVSIFDAMLPFAMRSPLHQTVRVVSSGPTGVTVGEAQVKLISKLSIAAEVDLTEKKTIAIIAVTDELLRFANSAIFQTELQRAVASAVDTSFISEITSGISTTPSNGGVAISVLQDLSAAMAGLTLHSGSKVFIAVSSDIAKAWAFKVTQTGELLFPAMTPTGGTVQGVPVFVTDAISSEIVAFDSTQIVVGDNGIDLDASNESSVQLDSAPDSPPGASTPYVSLWQLNLTALKATRYWSAKRLNAGAVSVITNVAYTGDSPQ